MLVDFSANVLKPAGNERNDWTSHLILAKRRVQWVVRSATWGCYSGGLRRESESFSELHILSSLCSFAPHSPTHSLICSLVLSLLIYSLIFSLTYPPTHTHTLTHWFITHLLFTRLLTDLLFTLSLVHLFTHSFSPLSLILSLAYSHLLI